MYRGAQWELLRAPGCAWITPTSNTQAGSSWACKLLAVAPCSLIRGWQKRGGMVARNTPVDKSSAERQVVP